MSRLFGCLLMLVISVTFGDAETHWVQQPKGFEGVRILNNLCWELLNRGAVRPDEIGPKETFSLPCGRWVLLRSTAELAGGAELQVGIETDQEVSPAIVHSEPGETTLEAMRYLKAGTHTVKIECRGDATMKHLIVRAVPALHYAFYGAQPDIEPYGPYDHDFIQKYISPHVNVIIGNAFTGANPPVAQIRAWKQMGRSWIGYSGVPLDVTAENADAVERVFRYWAANPGYRHPLMDGIIVDELGGGDEPIYDVYRQAVERLSEEFPGKIFMLYGGGFFRPDRSRGFAQSFVARGGYICLEGYLHEQPNEDAARQFIQDGLCRTMPLWEEGLPGVTSRMVLVLGLMSQPTESYNVYPTVDFKVFMDMQMHTLATDPRFFALGGIQWYHAAYSDEENLRWAAHLFRHYCLEGNTNRATEDPYNLSHISNPDFAADTEGWTIEPAAPDSVRTGSHPGYSWLQGRTPRTSVGDCFLLMRRSRNGANRISQEIRELVAGRLYSLKMITGDYHDLVNEVCDKKLHAVAICIDGAEVMENPKMNFQFAYPNNYNHCLGKFAKDYNYWMNYHWRVFRAQAPTARLIISDWAGEKEPGGPIGQELMLNFIEVEPYFGP